MTCARKATLYLVLTLVGIQAEAAQRPMRSVALFYGSRPPVVELGLFDDVVLEPRNTTAGELKRLKRVGSRAFAYLSVGEVAHSHPWFPQIDKRWIVGENAAWRSSIIDPQSAGWRNFLLARVAELKQRGYAGIFLDTLDSYQAVYKKPDEHKRCAQALAMWVRQVASRHQMKMIFNRGFEIVPYVKRHVTALAAESLFRGWEPNTERYVEVKAADRAWLLGQLKRVRDRFGVPVIAIDYVDPLDRRSARQTARQIAALGITPWVATPALDTLGVGLVEPIPRRVIFVRDSQEEPRRRASVSHLYFAMPLEYLGFRPHYIDVRAGLPQQMSNFAGSLVWFQDDQISRPPTYRRWLEERLKRRQRVALIGRIGFQTDGVFLRRLGIEIIPGRFTPPTRITRQDAIVGFESPILALSREVMPWTVVDDQSVVHLQLTDKRNKSATPTFTAPWGGLALDPYVIATGHDDRSSWLLNPFAFLKQALALPDIPIPDVTTENGLRILTAHIDGDGFPSRAEFGKPVFSAEIIHKQILERYRIPTTVSVVEGEVGPAGLYPKLSEQMEAVARQIFRLPYVELASHSFSHPFDWRSSENERKASAKQAHYLKIGNYRFNADREVAGSIDYINRRLAPKGKRVKVMLWSGDALPGVVSMRSADQAGVFNVNGGNTAAALTNPTMTEVAPMGAPVGDDHFQVYAPVMNENVYTNNWLGPFYGYQRAVETFQLTDKPRRIKPVGIYYHFYSGTKQASLNALRRVYDWALAEKRLPLFLSEYAPRVSSCYTVAIAKTQDDRYLLSGLGALRTVRLPKSLGWPDLRRSVGVIGVRELPQGRYVALLPDARGRVLLAVRAERPTRPHLFWANGQVRSWNWRGNTLTTRIVSHLPLEVAFSTANKRCSVKASAQRKQLRHGVLTLQFSKGDSGSIQLRCRR
ncbi:MAG: endo alpha-1,4 polygalactosaminidase [Deltaproteobacteria bacterium]|nr:endo alpha-1,4 polygalactosaminidase [Deltaproteobacteria bacterium]